MRSQEETAKAETSPIVLTIGHSTRTIEEFINLVLAHGVSRVVDVRTIPRSRHNPQFNADSLPRSLKNAGVGYVHMAGLGGLRHPTRGSLNIGWSQGGVSDVRGSGAPSLSSLADNGCLTGRRPTRSEVADQVFPWGSQWLPPKHTGNF